MINIEDFSKITVFELIELLKEYNEDIYCDGKSINSHNFKSMVHFVIEDSDIDVELFDIEISRLLGCGCSCGITFRLKKS